MDERSIRKDKELARAALKGLAIYGDRLFDRGSRMSCSRSGGWSMRSADSGE